MSDDFFASGSIFRCDQGDAVAWFDGLPADSIDLVFGSPPSSTRRRVLKMPDRVRCPSCQGTTLLRWWRSDDDAPCPECGGVGSLPFGAPPLSDEAALYRHEVHDDDGEVD